MLAALGSLAGSVVSGLFGNKQADKNIKYQKQFAKEGIQWKVADAKKAGIHPLAALGANTHSFAPVQGGDWSGLASAGQDLGRAIQSKSTKSERLTGFQAEAAKLSLDKARLENDVLRADLASRIAKVKQPGTPPPMPDQNQADLMPGQAQSPGIEEKKHERTGFDPRNPAREAAVMSDHGYVWTGTGYAPIPSKDFQDRAEDMIPAQAGWFMRNQMLPSFQVAKKPPFPALSDEYWGYHPFYQEYRLFRRKRSGTHSRFRFRGD